MDLQVQAPTLREEFYTRPVQVSAVIRPCQAIVAQRLKPDALF